ncbi:alkaline phosphatase family protein [Oryzihumus leptocrescens]|uniref:Phosphoesterase family protein n=1 Tax=Oryzihumus leptocrescens TaxID=297536 RepID=A0A542ZF25_9MICO|nr:alkaline phosphatase family protein [Oryzihumus leptocrescens]TQL58945.1 phosphoesterase family protein [Oryzihumus leptocrescens]
MSTTPRTTKRVLALLLAAAVVLLGAGLARPDASRAATATPTSTSAYVPPVKHVFVINIENKGYDTTWGAGSAAPYLAQTLRSQGVLLNTYYGTAHNSQPNYVAQISGQGPNAQMQGDCQVYSQFAQTGTAAPGQAVGNGCVFPASVPNLTDQLKSKGLAWRGYMEDMGTPCRHPALNATDDTQKARVGDQYAARHNPFMYFSSITGAADCGQHVVDLNQLSTDLASTSTTPNLSYITPNLCHDGHDSPCVDGQPGGLTSVNSWLQTWVPKILNSPAYKNDGMLVITADESDGPQSDATACCGEGPGPNAALPGITGLGGGRIGALVLSRYVKANTWSTTSYNHYSLLASIEDVFKLPYLGYAGSSGLNRFGLDVYNSGWNK